MRIGIFYNPISGYGQGERVSRAFADELARDGHEVRLEQSSKLISTDSIPLDRFDLVVVAGGDGTMMAALTKLAAAKVPVYMVPMGNESLFARYFGMRRDVNALRQAIAAGYVAEHALAEIQGKPFFTMASIGIDSEIVAAIAAARTSTIKHWGYFWPTLRCAFRHIAPRVSLVVDGVEQFKNKRGFLIIANTPGYALGVRFVPEASSLAPTLSARFFPYLTAIGFLRWFTQCLISGVRFAPHVGLIQGTSFVVTADAGPYPVQADGESAGSTPVVVTRSLLTIRVLCPPHQT